MPPPCLEPLDDPVLGWNVPVLWVSKLAGSFGKLDM